MKKIVQVVLFSTPLLGIGQNAIYLGKDTTYCSTADTIRIGENLSIQGSNLDMEYLWTCNYTYAGHSYNAEHVLDVVTIPNPRLKGPLSGNEWFKFVLTAKQNGETYKDSINIRFSGFIYSTAYESIVLYKGDSVKLQGSGVGGGIAPLKFSRWETTVGIDHPYEFPTWCKNTGTITGVDISMKAVFEDSVGCQVKDSYYRITFLDIPSGNKEFSEKNISMSIRDGYLYFDTIEFNKYSAVLYNLNGIKLLEFDINSNKIKLPAVINKHEVVVLKICDKGQHECKSYKLSSF